MDSDLKLDTAVILALIFLMGSALFILAFVNIPDKNQTLFAALVGGVIGSGMTAYINYRWGSSKGSAAKDAMMATMAEKLPNQ